MDQPNVVYSTNGEDWYHHEFGDLLDDMESCGDLEVGQTYYVGTVVPIPAKRFVHAWDFVDAVTDSLYEEVGECASDFDINEGALDELKALLTQWLENHTNISTFFRIGKVEEQTITEADLNDYNGI